MIQKHGWTPKPPPRINPPPPPNVSERVGLVVSKEQADQLDKQFADEIAEYLESYHATRGEVYIRGELSRNIQGILVKNLLEQVFGVLGVSVKEQK